jgi:hypothetical protein
MSNSYAIEHGNKSFCLIENKVHSFELPENQPAYNGYGDVLGCGLLMNPENSVAIFFTSNGILMGQFTVPQAGININFGTKIHK